MDKTRKRIKKQKQAQRVREQDERYAQYVENQRKHNKKPHGKQAYLKQLPKSQKQIDRLLADVSAKMITITLSKYGVSSTDILSYQYKLNEIKTASDNKDRTITQFNEEMMFDLRFDSFEYFKVGTQYALGNDWQDVIAYHIGLSFTTQLYALYHYYDMKLEDIEKIAASLKFLTERYIIEKYDLDGLNVLFEEAGYKIENNIMYKVS